MTFAPTNDEYLLVYGTLLSGEPSSVTRLGARVALLGACTIRGQLYDLGEYPAFLPDGDQDVSAELYRIRDPGTFDDLDRYEGYDPSNPAESLYRRIPLRLAEMAIFGARAHEIDVWIYVYAGSVGNALRIESGSWREHRLRRARARRAAPRPHG